MTSKVHEGKTYFSSNFVHKGLSQCLGLLHTKREINKVQEEKNLRVYSALAFPH